jgi:hypothetical protein
VSELLAALNNGVDQETKRLKTWPKDAARLGNNLRRLAPSLRAIGINVEFPSSHRDGRQIKIESETELEPEPDPERPRKPLSPTVPTVPRGGIRSWGLGPGGQ